MRRRRQFWIGMVVGCVSAALAVVTAISREWIELLFGVDPDNGSGSLEWAIVAALAVIAIACFGWARLEWRRASSATI
jgi:hypothetical protein